ncbi:hypothetical protein CONPUDRAFT_152823 [Coniophora puteana RWD-64-598 SS2]|uniref:Uncharacterized protein n=1 Tax=Coniophora puteana (strain RWD-64-598) TaxID=741705 RepID=A0A5M3MS00_CONPW|nr:uncharacterized protein CONPUDRAFT_152823 [Coniophora puteana RWD-64-598 SS2]EIW81928.1 hypothetical protein CONPUDRAFT_152823 [Coniophora puteana RWD-64-598 SS2]
MARRSAEYDSNERRPFSECLPGTRVELLDTLEQALTKKSMQIPEEGRRMIPGGRVEVQGSQEHAIADRKIVGLFGDSGSGKSSVAYSTAERLRSQHRLATTLSFSRKRFSRSNTDYVFLT